MPDQDAGAVAHSPLPEDQALINDLLASSQNHAATIGHTTKDAWWSTHSAMTMCSVILLFGLVVIGISALLALKGLDKDAVLKTISIPMIVVSAIFLVVAGYSDSQVAPAMGLLGTIIGYVLGTSKTSDASSNNRQSDTASKPSE